MFGGFRFAARGGGFFRGGSRNGAHFFACFEEELLLLLLGQLRPGDGAGEAGDEEQTAQGTSCQRMMIRGRIKARETLGWLRLGLGRGVLGAGRGPFALAPQDGV